MHKVNRNDAPKELEKKNKQIKSKNISEIDVEKEWSNFSKTKLKKETLRKLQDMYAYCCAYCEGEIESTSSAHIEHFKPKSLYPNFMFDYNNLHYVCQKCNTNKSNKYDEKMIDPSIEDPEEHIYFNGTEAKSYDERGQIMIDTLKLNDVDRIRRKTKLLKAFDEEKKKIRIKYYELEDMSKDRLIDFRDDVLRLIIKMKKGSRHGEEYCTMVKHYSAKTIIILSAIALKVEEKINM